MDNSLPSNNAIVPGFVSMSFLPMLFIYYFRSVLQEKDRELKSTEGGKELEVFDL